MKLFTSVNFSNKFAIIHFYNTGLKTAASKEIYSNVSCLKSHKFSYGPPIVQNSMTEEEAIKFILQKKIVGFARVRIDTPENIMEKFIQLPPLCVREKVTIHELKRSQKSVAKHRGLLLNGQTAILSKFAADDIVLGNEQYLFVYCLFAVYSILCIFRD